MAKPNKKRQEKLDQLRALDHAARKLRSELGLRAIDKLIWKGVPSNTEIILKADGYGGATVLEVEGIYPLDFKIRRSQTCQLEEEACRLAKSWYESLTISATF